MVTVTYRGGLFIRVSNCTVSVCLAGEFLVFCIGGSILMGGGCY